MVETTTIVRGKRIMQVEPAPGNNLHGVLFRLNRGEGIIHATEIRDEAAGPKDIVRGTLAYVHSDNHGEESGYWQVASKSGG